MIDYASFLLETRKLLKEYEEAMTRGKYNEAIDVALDAVAEMRLLAHAAKEKRDARQEK